MIIRLSGPLKECYARDHGLDFEKMLSASDYKEKYFEIRNHIFRRKLDKEFLDLF